MEKDTLTYQDYFNTLMKMVERGNVWAFCPKCHLPLDRFELKKKKCTRCGKFQMQKILFRKKNNNC